MKLLVYVLSTLLLVSSVRAQDDGYPIERQDLDISDLDTEAVDALKEGINWIYGKAAEKYGIGNRDIDVTKVNKAQKWQDKGDNYYFFDVESENNDAWINSTYNVRALGDGEFRVVNEWNYTIDEKYDTEEASTNYDDNEDTNESELEIELPNPDTNVELELELELECVEEDDNTCKEGEAVDSSEIDTDEDLRDALTHGIQWIFEKAKNKFGIDNSEITVRHVDQICRWEKNGATYYHFEVEATNADNDSVDAKFNVKRRQEGDSGDAGDLRVVNEWSYNIDYADENQEDQNDAENDVPDENDDVYQDNAEEEMNVEVQYDVENDYSDNNNDEDNNDDDNNDDNNDNDNNDDDKNDDDNNDDDNDDDDDVNVVIYPEGNGSN